MLKIKNVEICFEEQVLNQTDLQIPEHCITLLRGVSGSGKTSLLYRIGLISEDRDFVYKIHGEDLSKADENIRNEFRRNHYAFVLQDNSLYEQYDVLGNLKMYAAFGGKTYTEEEYRTFLSSVNLNVPFHQPVSTLSGGEKQRTSIACCLAKDTEILILDEPTSFLDSENEKTVFQVLRNVCDQYRKTIIITSHSPVAMEAADEVYEIENKELIEKRHYEEKESDSFSKEEKKIPFSFIFSYAAYFFRKFAGTETCMILALTFSLLLMSVLKINTDRNTAEGIAAFQSLSENQIFVTKDDAHKTADGELEAFAFSFQEEGVEVYPYIRTLAVIDGTVIPVFPLFEDSHVLDGISAVYDGELYLSSSAYRKFQENHINATTAELNILVQNESGEMEDTGIVFSPAGVLNRDFRSKYLESDVFAYCSYETLKEIYEKEGLLHQEMYEGYTVRMDSFESYSKAAEELEKTDYGITLFYDYIDELQNLAEVNRKAGILIVCAAGLLTGVIMALMETMYFRKRDREMMMLKINGAGEGMMFKIAAAEILIQCLLAFVIASMIIAVIFRSVSSVIVPMLAVLTAVTMICLILEWKLIRSVSAEKILRQ